MDAVVVLKAVTLCYFVGFGIALARAPKQSHILIVILWPVVLANWFQRKFPR